MSSPAPQRTHSRQLRSSGKILFSTHRQSPTKSESDFSDEIHDLLESEKEKQEESDTGVETENDPFPYRKSAVPKKDGKIDWEALDDTDDNQDDERYEDEKQQMRQRLWALLDEEFDEFKKPDKEDDDDDKIDDKEEAPLTPPPVSSAGLYSGFLTKSGGKVRTKKWNRRWFILDETQLAYYKKQGEKMAAGTILLSTVSAVQYDEKKGDKTVNLVTKKRTYIIVAESVEEANIWAALLNIYVNKHKPSPGSITVKALVNKITKTVKLDSNMSLQSAKAAIAGSFAVPISDKTVIWSPKHKAFLEDFCCEKFSFPPIGFFIQQQDTVEMRLE